MIQTTRITAVSALLLWSMTASAQELVHFPSFEDNGPGRPSTVLDGYLSRPTGEGQHPAVIFLHGCGGLLMGWLMGRKIEPGESDWAGELTRRGYAVLMVDSFAPRGRREMCAPRTSDPALYFRNRPRDAYGALLFLQAQPFVRPDRIGIMGWSQGGGALLFAIGTQSFSRPAELPRGDFRAAVAFYPSSCDEQRQRPSWSTTIPLMVLIGSEDVRHPTVPDEPSKSRPTSSPSDSAANRIRSQRGLSKHCSVEDLASWC